METWFLVYILTLGTTETHVAVEMPDEPTCLRTLNSFVYASEILEGPPDPHNPDALHRELIVRDKVCQRTEESVEI